MCEQGIGYAWGNLLSRTGRGGMNLADQLYEYLGTSFGEGGGLTWRRSRGRHRNPKRPGTCWPRQVVGKRRGGLQGGQSTNRP